jgi:hypothetical protein
VLDQFILVTHQTDSTDQGLLIKQMRSIQLLSSASLTGRASNTRCSVVALESKHRHHRVSKVLLCTLLGETDTM